MATMSTTVNVNESCPATPGTFTVKAWYNEVADGSPYGPFASRESAEKCAQVLAGRSDVKKVEIIAVA